MPMANQFNKTRIAPTPSGYLHLGNILSFAITACLAQKTSAKILLRIDDMDQARANPQYVQDIFDTLNFLEIPWHEGPRSPGEFVQAYSQLHRMAFYKSALNKLADGNLVFGCTCTRSQMQNGEVCNCINKKIPLNTPNASWRLHTDADVPISVRCYDGDNITTTLPPEMKNFVVRKKDGYPAYQLTSVIDDVFYGVDLIIRGQDLWASTLAQQYLAAALKLSQFNNIVFYHHPLLTEPSGNKLSKSAGAMSIKHLHEISKTPAHVFALIADAVGIKESVTSWQQLAESYLSF
jgi:glutamyl/glutaminyl-tRNA synthetase